MSSKKILTTAFTRLLIDPQALGIRQQTMLAGDPPVSQPNQFYQKPLPPVGQPGVFGLTDGAPVKLKTQENLSSKSAKTNDLLKLDAGFNSGL